MTLAPVIKKYFYIFCRPRDLLSSYPSLEEHSLKRKKEKFSQA